MGRGSRKGKYDFWKHGVSPSMVGKFLICREQCRLHYIEGYRSRKASEALQFGSACHYVLQHWIHSKKPPTQELIRKTLGDFRRSKERLRPYEEDLDSQLLEKIFGLAEVVMVEYFKQWRRDRDSKSLGTEIEINAEYKYVSSASKWPYSSAKTLPFLGFIDWSFESKTGKHWIMDTKCLGEIVADDMIQELPLNFQMNSYLWAWEQAHGTRPYGVIMNCIRRPGATWKQGESLEEFCDRVHSEIEKKPGHYFQRIEYHVTDKEFNKWLNEQFHPIMEELRMWAEGMLPRYVNPTQLKIQRRKTDLYNFLTVGDKTGIVKLGEFDEYELRNRRVYCEKTGRWTVRENGSGQNLHGKHAGSVARSRRTDRRGKGVSKLVVKRRNHR